jgi:hypothetical protein
MFPTMCRDAGIRGRAPHHKCLSLFANISIRRTFGPFSFCRYPGGLFHPNCRSATFDLLRVKDAERVVAPHRST